MFLSRTTLFFLSILTAIAAQGQDDSVSIKVNRLTFENVIETRETGDITVVSASRSAKKLDDLPVTIHVVTGEEIQMNGYVTLVDVLKSLPGMKVSQPGSGEGGEMFMMRGLLGNQYTKILIDNVPVKPSVLTGLPIEAQLPVRQAERIEFIYGPASAIYGGDAAIGVINILTKKAKSGVFANADISLGSNTYRYTNFHVGGKAGRNQKILDYSFFGSFSEIHDMNIFRDTLNLHPLGYLEQQGTVLNLGDRVLRYTEVTEAIMNQYQLPMDLFFNGILNYEGTITTPELAPIPSASNMLGFTLKYKKWDFSWLNMYRKTHSSLGRSPFLYKYNSTQYFMADITQKISVNFNTTIGKLNSNTSMYISGYMMDENSSFGVNFIPDFVKAYQFAASHELTADQVFTYNHKFLELIGGVSTQFAMNLPLTNYLQKPFKYDFELEPSTTITIDTTDFTKFGLNPHAFLNLSCFFQAYLNFNKLKIVGGFRTEYNTLFVENAFSPRLGILYSINENHSLRASTGKAFRPPSGNQLFQSTAFRFLHPGNTDTTTYYVVIPNPKLLPEYFNAHELGYRGYFLGRRIAVDLALYYNTIENLISTDFVIARDYYPDAFDSQSNEFTRINVNRPAAETRLTGFDMAITFRKIVPKRNIDLRLSGTYMYGSETLSTGQSIRYLRGIPNYMFKIGISGNPFRRAYLNIESTIMGPWNRAFIPEDDSPLAKEYSQIDGYFVADLLFGYRAHKNLNLFLKINNIFDANYGGIDATGMDADLRYNPQMGINIRIGMTFMLN